MSDAVVNQPANVPFLLRQFDGTPITGATDGTAYATDPVVKLLPSGATTITPTITEIGAGWYSAVFTPTATGDWLYYHVYDADNDWSETVQVETAAQADPAAALEGFVATATATVSDTSTDLTLRRGDTYRRNLTITQPDGSLYDLNGATVWLTVKQRGDRSADDSAAVLKLYWVSGGASSGIVAASPSAGVIAVTMTAAQTAALSVGSAIYCYDVQVEKSGLIDTPITGGVIVERDVTIRTSTP